MSDTLIRERQLTELRDLVDEEFKKRFGGISRQETLQNLRKKLKTNPDLRRRWYTPELWKSDDSEKGEPKSEPS